jgi:hypothetical protein
LPPFSPETAVEAWALQGKEIRGGGVPARNEIGILFIEEFDMRKHLNWVLAASLGVGGMAFMGCEKSGTGNTTASNNTSPSADNKVINNKDEAAKTAGSQIPGDQIGSADLSKIYGTLGDTAEAAFTKGGFDDLVERLNTTDRDRIGKVADQKFADLDGRVDQLNKDYSGKYNGKFNLDDSKVFENWAKVQKTGEDKDKTFAKVTIPASHGLPELTVPMVKDHESWKIDAPDDLSAQQLKDNVLAQVTAIDTMKDQWPGGELEAQRAMVHHVLAAVMNKPAK